MPFPDAPNGQFMGPEMTPIQLDSNVDPSLHMYVSPEQMTQNLMNVAHNPAIANQRVMTYRTQNVLDNLNGIASEMQPWVQQQMLPALEHMEFSPVIAEELSGILSRLGEQGPSEVGGERNRAAQYWLQEGRGDRTAYTVNASRLRKDMQFVQRLMQSVRNPQQAQFLQQVYDALNTFGWRGDPMEMAVAEYNDMQSNSRVAQGTRYGLRFAGVLLAGSLAVANGIMAYTNNTASSVPWIYGGLALFAARPDLLNGRARRTADEANMAITTLRRETEPRRFEMRGSHWAEFAQNIMQGGIDPETMALIRRSRNSRLSDTEREQLLQAIAPEETTPPDIRNGIIAMINQGRLAPFINTLRNIRSEDTQHIVSRYIQDGSWRYDDRPVG